jgi:hypothetical protein
MVLCFARRPRPLRAAVVAGLLGFFVQTHTSHAEAQSPEKVATSKALSKRSRDVHSRNFLLHTDLSEREAKELVEQLETMLRRVIAYWGRPVQGKIECYVIRDFNNFPSCGTNTLGIGGIKTAGGATLMDTALVGKCCRPKSIVYANARSEVVRHEAIHAYCHQTFGRIGPVWYSEGMAEMGHYWEQGDTAVHAGHREIEFLRANLPKSHDETISGPQVTGDSWQNYASRWALCYFLVNNPNYAQQFQHLGRSFLAGKDIRFDQVYDATSSRLWFEYLFFRQHICRGYRVDLCAWNWRKKFAGLLPGQTATAAILAGRGWQPSGVTIAPGMKYEYVATGNWRIAGRSKDIDADGDEKGCGRLVGALMNDYQLGPEFDLGAEGLLPSASGGDLYLRCRNAWNRLSKDSGHVTIRLKIKEDESPSQKNTVSVIAAERTKSEKTN